nr:MAG TPA: hypothetical protein [Caudoviricetes sp.]
MYHWHCITATSQHRIPSGESRTAAVGGERRTP